MDEDSLNEMMNEFQAFIKLKTPCSPLCSIREIRHALVLLQMYRHFILSVLSRRFSLVPTRV